MKKIFKDYFTFSKNDRIAIGVLFILIIFFLWLPNFFSVKKATIKPDAAVVESIQKISDEKKASSTNNYRNSSNSTSSPAEREDYLVSTKVVLFTFDPNTLSEEGWIKLGIREKTAKTILNYRNKGGKFRQPEDIRKIWGLRKEEADRIIPFVKIADNKLTPNSNAYNSTVIASPAKPAIVDINTATPQQLKFLPQIGYSLPYKIVNFREKLGGFLTLQQVKETYGMTDSIYQAILPYLQIQSTEIRRININTASDYDLSMHPYIDKNVAKAIVIYRNQHGGYKQVEEVKKIVFITEEVFNKMAPYLAAE